MFHYLVSILFPVPVVCPIPIYVLLIVFLLRYFSHIRFSLSLYVCIHIRIDVLDCLIGVTMTERIDGMLVQYYMHLQ